MKYKITNSLSVLANGFSMCGIAGLFDANGIDKELLKSMSRVMVHRGPDDGGFFSDKEIGLANRRLSIVDVSGGRQPIHNEDESIWIVYNGELYNYEDLMEELVKKGHKFYTKSDTEVIVHAYEEFGHACLERLYGMFAFAIWDANKKELFIARDHIGIKPLYYYFDGTEFAFASEIKSILEDRRVKREIDETALKNYISFRTVMNEKTIFKGILKLPAAHYMVVKRNSSGFEVSVKKYWDFEFSSVEGSVEKFRELLKAVTKSHLIGEVPMGVFLSGGVDSSSLAAIMKQFKNEVKTFSVGFELQGYNEFEYSDMVAEYLSTDHHKLVLDYKKFSDSLPQIAWHFDEPMADHASIPLYHLAMYAKKHVTVLLSGEGPDELLAGYGSNYIDQILMKASRLRNFFLRGANLSFIPSLFQNVTEKQYLNNAVKALSLSYDDFFSEMKSTFSSAEKKELFKPEYRSAENHKKLLEYLHAKKTSELNRLLYSQIMMLQDGLLMKADKMTMAASVETRVPYLDRRIIEFAASLKDGMKIRKMTGKHILKEAMRPYLPKAVIEREKMGFPVPIDPIVSGEMKDIVSEVLLNGTVSKKYFNRNELEKLLGSHFRQKRNNGNKLFTLFMLEIWNRIFIEESCTKDSTLEDFVS